MVNYEARIAEMRAKGILVENDAATLKSSLEQKVASLPKQRSYSLELFGALLFGAIILLISIQVGLTDKNSSVEDVAHTLNAVRIGVSASYTFWALLLALSVVGFLVLYGLVHRYYNHIWRIQAEMTAAGEMIADLEVRQKEVQEAIDSLLDRKPNTKSATKTAIQTIVDLDETVGKLQREFAQLKAKCAQMRSIFPYTLASIAGSLPECR